MSNISEPGYLYDIGAGDGDAATGTGLETGIGLANRSSTVTVGFFGGSDDFIAGLVFSSGGHSIAVDGRFIRFFGLVLIVFFLLSSGNYACPFPLLPPLRPELLLPSELY